MVKANSSLALRVEVGGARWVMWGCGCWAGSRIVCGWAKCCQKRSVPRVWFMIGAGCWFI